MKHVANDPRRRLEGHGFAALLVVLLLAPLVPLLAAAPAAAQTAPRPIPPPLVVRITDAGFVPASITLAAGQTLHVDNETAADHTLTATDGWIDSGPIPPGGRFVLTTAAGTVGTHPFASAADPSFAGSLSVGLLDLPGGSGTPVSSVIPATWVGPSTTLDVHPSLGVHASRNRAIVGFATNARVPAANAALAAAGVTVVGGLSRFGLFAVEVGDSGIPGDFAALDAALSSLRADPVVRFASLDLLAAEPARVPQAEDPAWDPGGLDEWRWGAHFTGTGGPAGQGGNHWAESSRFPQAWNLLGALSGATNVPQTLVVDPFFTPHPDAPAQVVDLCDELGACTGPVPGDHGTAAASVIGAPFEPYGADPPTFALDGANPLAAASGNGLFVTGLLGGAQGASTVADFAATLDLVLEKRASTFPRLRVVNLPLSGVVFARDAEGRPATFLNAYGDRLCGPGANDDAADPSVPCTPGNLDPFLDMIANAAEAHRGIASAMASANVLLVVAAGNESGPYTRSDGRDWSFGVALPSESVQPLARLARTWGAGTPPVLVVESSSAKAPHDGSFVEPSRDPFSNAGGDVSAPGENLLAATQVTADGESVAGYNRFTGTSAASAVAAGLAGYLASLSPSSNYAALRNAIVTTARADTIGGAPRIDAYAAAMALPGSTVRMVDVNDPSVDGNARVFYDADGLPLGEHIDLGPTGGRTDDHDGLVDLRDLRRYRDAFLQLCLAYEGASPSCPAPTQIDLDGELNNPHFDLNLDLCIRNGSDPVCDTTEFVFSRLDFNGDGRLVESGEPVPINPANGAPLPGSPTPMTDLDVLRSVWGTGSGAETHGWTRQQLDELLVSADVTVLLDGIFGAGADSVDLELRTASGRTTPSVHIGDPSNFEVLSAPLDLAAFPGGEAVQLVAKANFDGAPSRGYVSAPTILGAGGDVTLRPCVGQASLQAPTTDLLPGQAVEVTFAYGDCKAEPDPDAVSGHQVTFEIVGDGEVDTVTATTDETGSAYIEVTAGSQPGPLEVRARIVVGGVPASTSLAFDVHEQLTLWYRFRQTNLEYHRVGTNDWSESAFDCSDDTIVDEPNCFSSDVVFDDFWGTEDTGFEREGTVSVAAGGGDGAYVDDWGRHFARGPDGPDVGVQLRHRYARAQQDGTPAYDDDVNRYYDLDRTDAVVDGDHAWVPVADDELVEGISVHPTPVGLEVTGLGEIASLDYPYSSACTPAAGSFCVPHEFDMGGTVPPRELLMLDRSDESALRYDWEQGVPLVVPRSPDGTYERYTHCSVIDRDFSSIPQGYWRDDDSDANLRYADLRLPNRTAGSRAAPIYFGNHTARYEFVAVVTNGAEPPADDLAFPDCDAVAPELRIFMDPDQAEEGIEAELRPLDAGNHPGATYSWNFGDGTPDVVVGGDGTVTHAWDDNGTYDVVLIRTEADGTVTVGSREVAVLNKPPLLYFATVVPGSPPAIHVETEDLGPVDRFALTVSVTSTTPGFVAPAALAWPQGERTIPLPAQAPGLYQLQVTVTDKDGASATLPATLFVAGAGPAGGGGGGAGGSSLAKSARSDSAAETHAMAPVPAAESRLATVTAKAAVVLDTKPVAAFVVSTVAPATGAGVAVRNASRAGGVPVDATLAAGDGRAPLPLAPDETATVTYLEPGAPSLALTVAGPPATTTATPLTVAGGALLPALAYEGAVAGAQGELVAVAARATLPGGAGAGGLRVRFTLGPSTVEATTGADGVTAAEITVPGPPGPRTIVAEVAGFGTVPPFSTSAPFTVGEGSAPLAEAGGPYVVGPDSTLVLAASAVDPDGGAPTFTWDLDLDGAYDDATGADATVPWADVEALLCGGACVLGATHEIVLHVADADGATSRDRAEVRIAPEFTLSVSPDTRLLVPGAAVNFEVVVGTTSGFGDTVRLTTGPRPTGVTATFGDSTITPGQSTVLTVKAGSTVGEQAFDLTIIATSGDVVRQATVSLGVEFGLIPQCTGSVIGRVTDASTGLPIANVLVGTTRTDTDGVYRRDDLAVAPDNGPRTYTFNIGPAGYHSISAGYTVACGVVSRRDFVLQPRLTGGVSGTVYSRPSGADGPLTPLADATIDNLSGIRSGPDGAYARNRELPIGTTETDASVRADADGHFTGTEPYVLRAGEVATGVDVVLVERCYGSILARVVDAATGRPVVGARVATGFSVRSSDGAGRALFENLIPLGVDGAPATVSVTARGGDDGPQSNQVQKSVTMPACGVTIPVDFAITFPREIRATLETRVVDADTGAPIPGATVAVSPTLPGTVPKTNAAGVSVYETRIAYGSPTSRTVDVTVSLPGYVRDPANPRTATLVDGQTTVVTHRLQQQRFGVVEGRVLDAVTGEPVEGADVSLFGASGEEQTEGAPRTGPDGRYAFRVPLGFDDAPDEIDVQVRDIPGAYWGNDVDDVLVGAGTTTVDVPLTPVCTGATIRGRVVNAETRGPIDGARVAGSGVETFTDADGRFVLGPITIGVENRPRQVHVTASKSGFVSATKSVTISCGADIVLDFGTDADGVGSIQGTVVDDGGDPVSGAFVATGFGGADTTDATGGYSIAGAPAGPGGGPRDWPVAVTPPAASGLGSASATATVRRDEVTVLDFVLGERGNAAPTATDVAAATTAGAPVAVQLLGFDADGDPITYDVTPSDPAEGSLSGTAPALTFTPAPGFEGVATFTYSVSDGEATSEAATVTVTVGAAPNEAPVAVVSGPAAAVEGSTTSLDASGSTDADGTIAGYAWDLDDDGAFDDGAGPTASVSSPDDALVTVRVRVTDDDGATAEATHVVTFANAPPAVALADDLAVDAGAVGRTGSFADAGAADTHTATVDWDDGAGPQPLTLGGGGFSLAHTYAASGTYEVTVVVCDDDGGCGDATFGVEVVVPEPENQPPVATIAGPSAAVEGSTVTFDASGSTDADGTVETYAWDLDDDGQFDDGAAATASVTRLDDAVVPVAVQVTDDGGATAVATATITFTNAVPVVAFADDLSVAAGAVGRSGTFADAGTGDTHEATVDWGDGGGPEPLALTGGGFTLAHTYATEGNHVVVVEVCDDDGGCAAAQFAVDVELDEEPPANVAPAAVVTGAQGAVEGDTVDLDGSASADTDGTVVAHDWDLDGDGEFDDATGPLATLTRDDDAVVDVGLRVTDDDGATATATLAVTFANAPPVVAVDDAAPAADGDGRIATTGTFADVGAGDTHVATVDWGDGGGPEPLALGAGTYTLDHVYAGPGTYGGTVEVCDDDGGCGQATFTVVVDAPDVNDAPVAAIAGPASATEGDTVTLDGSASSDVDGTVVAHDWDLDDDGDFDDSTSPAVDVSLPDEGALTVRLRVTDDQGATGVAEHTVTFSNAPPTVTLADDLAVVGSAVNRSGSFADPGGADGHTATVDWGDGAGPQPLPLDGTSFSLSHDYGGQGPAAGLRAKVLRTFGVTVTVCDDDGACATAGFPVQVDDGIAPPPPPPPPPPSPGPGDPEADLGVAITIGGSPTVGATGTYSIVVTNAGPDSAGGAVLTVELDDGVEVLAVAAPDGWACEVDGDVVRCEAGVALAVASATIAVDVRFTEAGDVVATTEITSAVHDPDPDDDTDAVTAFVTAVLGGEVVPPVTTTPPPPAPAPTAPPLVGGTVAPPTASPARPSSGPLPRTGTDAAATSLVAVLLAAAGAVLVALARRRRPR